MQANFSTGHKTFFVGVAQTLVVSSALVIGVTRIWDNKHHAIDVAVGAAVGSALQWANAVHVMKLFKVRQDTQKERKSGQLEETPVVENAS
jgi:membrane-associated phospholipid phosphatase